jgi:hypothetical protein
MLCEDRLTSQSIILCLIRVMPAQYMTVRIRQKTDTKPSHHELE